MFTTLKSRSGSLASVNGCGNVIHGDITGGRPSGLNVRRADAYCRCYLRHKREDTEVAQQSESGGLRGQAEGLSKRDTKIWLPVDMDDNTATASEDELKDGEIQDDGVVDDQATELDNALTVEESAGAASDQPDDQIAD